MERGGWVAKNIPLPKLCLTYPAMMKLSTAWHSFTAAKGDEKIYASLDTPLSILLILAFFHRKSANFAISINKDINYILIHNFYSF